MPNRVPSNRSRLHRVRCPVCGRSEIMNTENDDPSLMDQELISRGWQWSSQISAPEHEWHLVCPKHYESATSRTILKDAESNPERVEIPLINGDSST